jgi:hypothetical protein
MLTGEMIEELSVPEGDFVHRVLQADMKHVPAPQHTVQGQLDKECGFPHAGLSKNGAESPGGEDVFRFKTQMPERITKDQFLFYHIDIPIYEFDGPSGRPGDEKNGCPGSHAALFFLNATSSAICSAIDCGTCL